MAMNLSNVSIFVVFIQGILSFFSPCILPIIPLYISYLAGGMEIVDQKKILLNTLFFVLGISFAFVLLGFSFSALGQFFNAYRIWFARISGLIMIFFGLYQFKILGRIKILEQNYRLPFNLNHWKMNPLVALLLGFTFSFAWTPCIGPVLSSVLLLVSSSTTILGLLFIGIYTLGFVLPFLALGLFTDQVLSFLRKNQSLVQYTVKISAVLLIFIGILTLTGSINNFTKYLSTDNDMVQPPISKPSSESASDKSSSGNNNSSEQVMEGIVADKNNAPDFTLIDQYGKTHTLSKYRGKTIFLNFWATWCPPCKREMPDIENIYEFYGKNQKDVIIIGVANPSSKQYPLNQDKTEKEIKNFLKQKGYTFPVVMDITGKTFENYGIQAFPTTFMIDKNGHIFGYASGALSLENMKSIIDQTVAQKK